MKTIGNTVKTRENVHKVEVRFDQQQLQLLDNVKKAGRFGSSYENIIINIFREYIKQNFGRRDQ